MATKVEKSVVVNVPVETAYHQWTQFEEFPHFMGGISEIRQLDDTTLNWVAEIGGVRRQWTARILEQTPLERVAWAATEGATNAGAVYFSAAGPGQTAVRLELEYEPEGIVEKVGDKVGIVERRVEADLGRFKSFIEDAGYATGAWRGTVPGRVGTPGVSEAEASKGDSGKAGVSGKAVAAGVAGAAAAAVGAAAAAKAKSSRKEPETVVVETEVAQTEHVTPNPVVEEYAVPAESTYPADVGTPPATPPLEADPDRRV